MRTKLKSIW